MQYLESHLVEFHKERMGTVFLHEDQKRPTAYDSKSCFVISKVDMPTKQVSLMHMDPYDRQVFHKFDELAQDEQSQK